MYIDTDEIREVCKFYLPRMLLVPGMCMEITKAQQRAIDDALESEIDAGLDQAMQVLARRIKERSE